MKVSFSITDHVWVKLTERGEKHITEFASKCERIWDKPGLAKQALEDWRKQDGWYEFMFSELMELFGPIMRDGHACPFVDGNIFFEKPF